MRRSFFSDAAWGHRSSPISKHRAQRQKKRRAQRFSLEPLESRCLLSTITEFGNVALGNSQPAEIVSADGMLWLTEQSANAIGMVNPSSPDNVQSFSNSMPSNAGLNAIAAGPAGSHSVWFTEPTVAFHGEIGMLSTSNPSQAIQSFSPQGLTVAARPTGITLGPDGNGNQVIWYTDPSNNAIGMINPSNTSSIPAEIAVPSNMVGFGTFNSQITAGPGGNLYFTEVKYNSSGGIASSGIGIYNPASKSWNEVLLPSGSGQEPLGITVGPDNNIWFTEAVPNSSGTGYVSSAVGVVVNPVSTDPTITEIPISPASGGVTILPYRITAGPDGNLWFTENSTGGIGMVTVTANPASDPITSIPIPTTVISDPQPKGIVTGPDGSVWFADASGAVGQVTSQKGTPTITWTNPADITYGTPLSLTQLDATASVPGSFQYTPSSGTVLQAGSGQKLSVRFTPNDTTDYATASDSVYINVNQATPTITWANPAAITYGTALSSTQLDATASVPGSFQYTPSSGTVLQAGSGQKLSVRFTPNDTTDYTTASDSVYINVVPNPPQIQGATVVTTQKTNKRGKPIGKPVLNGYKFTFNMAMNSSNNKNNYQVQTYALVTVKQGKKKTKVLQLQNIGFSLDYISNNTVQVLLTGKQAFKYGGQITLIGTGISSAAGAFLNGNAVYNIAKGGFSIS